MNKTRIVVCGAMGRMGASIIRLAQNSEHFSVVAGVERKEECRENTGCVVVDDLARVVKNADVVIDFTAPIATLGHIPIVVAAGKAMVIGTTGFTPEQLQEIRSAAGKIPVVFSPNMSVGLNLLFRLVKEAARALSDYDIEIVELHHNRKKDAPSGTAAKLADIMATELGRKMSDVGVYGRQGDVGARTKEEIGVMAVRAGDIVGDHTVYFAGQGERVELTHRAHSRDTLASGALKAARWLTGRQPGLYEMLDVLNLK